MRCSEGGEGGEEEGSKEFGVHYAFLTGPEEGIKVEIRLSIVGRRTYCAELSCAVLRCLCEKEMLK